MKKLVIFLAAAAITALSVPAHAGDSGLAIYLGSGHTAVHYSDAVRRYDRYDGYRYGRDAGHLRYYRDRERIWLAHSHWHRHNDLRHDRHYLRDHAHLHRRLGIAPFEFHYRDRRW